MSAPQTFRCTFKCGAMCEIVGDKDRKAADGLPDPFETHWHRLPLARMAEVIPQYRQWAHTVYAECATAWDVVFPQLFPAGPPGSGIEPEMWMYRPNTPPERVPFESIQLPPQS